MHLVKLQQRTKEWLEWRRNKIMASDARIIMRHRKVETIQELYNQKTKCYEPIQNEYMQYGIKMEPIALKAFEKETRLIMFPAVGVSEDVDWMAASFDGMTIEGDAIVEIKCPGKKTHSMALNGKVPTKHFPQIQHQIYVAGIDFAYYYSFDGENGVIIEVKRDQNFIDQMIEKEYEFWERLKVISNAEIRK